MVSEFRASRFGVRRFTTHLTLQNIGCKFYSKLPNSGRFFLGTIIIIMIIIIIIIIIIIMIIIIIRVIIITIINKERKWKPKTKIIHIFH